MPKTRPIPWEADPHTKAKHALYRQYLSKWTPIMVNGKWRGNVTYAEGFAGPGVYLDGSPGSPVIALRSVIDDERVRKQVRVTRMRFVFIDREPRCITRLRTELTTAAHPVPLNHLPDHGIDLVVERGECEPDLERHLTALKAWGRPMLVVLDTWGGSVSHDLVAKVADNPSSEVVITFQPQYFARFAGVDDIEHGDKVFGDSTWRAVADEPSDRKERWLLRRYRDAVRLAGFPFVLDFELIDQRSQALYLVFGTTHRRGLEKMKEAMWEVDEISGVGYRDPRDPGQQTLTIEIEPQTAPLRRLIAQHLRGLPEHRATVEQLREFALFQTVFKASQVMPVVRNMVDVGELNVTSSRGRLSFRDTVSLL